MKSSLLTRTERLQYTREDEKSGFEKFKTFKSFSPFQGFKTFDGSAVMSEEPSIGVEQVERSRDANPGGWLFRWRVRNQSEKALCLLSVRVPHGKFKAEECKFLPSVAIAAKNSFILEVAVTCDEPPDTSIENAFLILLVHWQEDQWRFFVRLRISVDQEGRPDAATESISVQRVGFSGVHTDG